MIHFNSERRSTTLDVIDKLLSERREMLVLFCELAGQQPFNLAEHGKGLQKFCEVLVDYSAFAHFEFYERIINDSERREEVVNIAQEVYPRILEASEVASEFNDKYDEADHALDLSRLDADLSKLGEELAVRIEMEDRIIDALT